MSTVIDELVADAGLSADESADVAAFLRDLEQLAEAEPPRPSEELAALLAAPPVPGGAHRPRLRLVAAAGAAAAMGAMTVTGVAAAANELPETAQTLVADLSERLLPSPLHFPRPVPAREEPAPEPTQAETDQQDEPAIVVEPPPTQPAFPIPDEGLPTTAPQRTGEMLTLEPSPTPSQEAPPPPEATSPAPSPTGDATAPPSGSASPSPSDSPAPSETTEPSTTTEPTPTTDPRLGESPTDTASDEPEAGEEPSTSPGAESTGSAAKPPV